MTTDFVIQGRRGPLQIRMLTPKNLPDAPIIVVVHGFAPTGNQDGLLNVLAVRLCRSGLRVVMPNITSEASRRMSPTAVSDVDDAVRWSAMTSGQQVSLFGISFSGGLVISAAAQPNYEDYVKMVFCISGFNSVDRLGRYYLHDRVTAPDGQPYGATPTPGVLAPMALQYLDELVPANSVGPLIEPLQAILANVPSEEAATEAQLTPAQRELLDDLLNIKTEAMRERYHALLERHRAELAAISPMGKIQRVHGALYVLHGAVDTTIPRGEAEWTRAEALHKANARFLITPWVHHAILDPHAPYLEKLRAGYFVSQTLDTALRPSPLPASMR
jgi:pimeloyl-ACP methyl ester carboxylesterase